MTTSNINNNVKDNTHKRVKKIKNGMSYELNGWTYISISGNAKERGYAYGYLIAEQFKRIQEMLIFLSYSDYGQTWDFFIKAGKLYLKENIMQHFREYYDEMNAIAQGCSAAGTPTTVDEIIAWNNYFTLTGGWYPQLYLKEGSGGSKEGGAPDRCSAFIAVGDYTQDGKIVVAHNSFSTFVDGQYMNCILDINPDRGHRMLMQTSPGWMWSGTDFFVTSKGIVGTETTIGGFIPYENNYTISCRIRQAMQYGNNLDDYVKILLHENSGDYANSWLFGDTNTNEILRIELGLKYHNVERTKNGYFVGFNATYDPRIRNLECSNSGFDDVRRHQGARRVRLTDLMEENKGKLNVSMALELIADHYDVYLNKENKCSRTVCSHYDLDAREFMSQADRPKPFAPRGAVDGCVTDTELIKNMTFMARWGSSCGTPFDAASFCNINRQWNYLKPHLNDRPSQPWTEFTVYNALSKINNMPHKKRTRRYRAVSRFRTPRIKNY
jgi:hypothetical protein